MKRCTKCGKEQELLAFSKKASCKDGLSPRCKACCKLIDAEWFKKNRERSLSTKARYYAANKEKMAVAMAANYIANRNRRRLLIAEWKRANPEKVKRYINKRRAMLAGSGGSYTEDELQSLLHLYEYLCAYCRKAPYEHLDHDTPISRGGTNDISNLLPSCATCNLKKGTRTGAEFRARLGLT